VSRGTNLGQLRWPHTPDFMAVARAWRQNASQHLISLVWQAYDLLVDEVLSQIDISLADEQLERSVTQYLAARLDRVMTGDEPFDVLHGPYEFEQTLIRQAQPPLYDIAFYLLENERVMWPLEAKVLRTDGTIASYVSDIRNQFLECRYAPFSSEAGMLAYLCAGEPVVFFSNVAKNLGVTLDAFEGALTRDHRTSLHDRNVETGKPFPEKFTCHHLAMRLVITAGPHYAS
jgi:hypothetical protein